MKIKINELQNIAVKMLVEQGASKKDAEIIVEDFMDSELRGKKDHGFSSFKKFAVKDIKKTATGVKPMIEKETESYMLINGNGLLGQVVCKDVMDKTIAKAKKKGIAMTGIYNMESYMTPGTYARQAAEKDVIAIICNYGGKNRTAPFGSIDPVFGTNPIAIGIPSNTINIVMDMATSKEALAKVRMAEALGENVPEGIGIDKNGNPTTSPTEILNGAILPFGEYKGSALALVIEVLTKEMFNLKIDDTTKVCRGYLFIVIDPSVFGELTVFKQNVSDLIKKIKSSRKAKGVTEILVPGEKGERLKQENLKKGYLEIDDKIMKDLR